MMESFPNLEEQYRKSFESYMRYFPLSEEDLQKPILDVGAGTGGFIEYVHTKFGNNFAFAVEKHSPKIPSEKTGYAVADGFKLPFKDNTFEVVLSKNYLPMFVDEPEEIQRALLELIRVTKTGGKIMSDISTPETEERQLEDDSKRDSAIRTTNWLKKRLEGAKIFQDFLNGLKQKGFQIDLKEGPKNEVIAIIQKS